MADRRQQLKYKQDRCLLCDCNVQETIDRFGENAFHKVFQFHHVDPKTKDPDYDNLIRRKISTEQLDELDKCVLLCSKCHPLLENQNNRFTVRITVSAGGRTAEQLLHGQVLLDQVSKTGRFVTNERVKVIPYHVYLGDAEPVLLFGSELEQGKLVGDYLAKLAEYRRLSIRRFRDNKLMLQARHVEPDSLELQFLIGFPVITAELEGETCIWTRNGRGLTDDGEVMEQGIITLKGATVAEPEV